MKKAKINTQKLIRKFFPKIKCKKLALAISGGCDSVALFYLLKEYCGIKSIELVCYHVDHGLRLDSAGDAEFVAELCRANEIELYSKTLKAPDASDLKHIGVEKWARESRYGAFVEFSKESGADVLATAHNANDQTETILMRMMRGSSIDGFSGIRSVRKLSFAGFQLNMWRPMLGISRKELETFLIENEKVWREDSTNKDISFFRNRLRRNIIPELNLILPGSLEHIALLSSEISEVNRYIQNRAKKFFQLNFCDNCIRIPKKAPKLLVREVIKAFLFESGNHCYVNRKNINSLLVLCRSGKPGRVMLGEDKVVYFYDDKLVYENFAIEKKSGERLLFLDEVVRFGNIEAVLKDSVQEKTGDYCFWIDPAIVSGDLVVRYRRPGDRLLIKNSAGRKKVSDLFIDKKIPVFRREKVVLFCDSEKVLFVPGITCGRGVLESPKDGYLCVSVKTLKE